MGRDADNVVLGNERNGIDGAHPDADAYPISTGKVTQNNVPTPPTSWLGSISTRRGSQSRTNTGPRGQRDASALKTAFAAKGGRQEVKIA